MVLSLLIPKFVLGIALVSVIMLGLRLPAPHRESSRIELRTVIGGALALYLVGAVAAISGRGVLSALVLASGICVSTVAVWLSRGTDAAPPPTDDVGGDDTPPPGPDPNLGGFDWDAFERELTEWIRLREPSGVA